MSETTETPPRRKRRNTGRSPAYPAISLDKAMQRVKQLYDQDRQYPIPVAKVASTWGYANLNGPAALAVSALKKFGLVDDEGSKEERTIAVSDLAVQILNHPAEDARERAIKEAALRPPIHREMWDQYGTNLPSEATLEWRLTRDRGFTDTGAKEFIREYVDTIIYAKLGEEDASSSAPSDRSKGGEDLREATSSSAPEITSTNRPMWTHETTLPPGVTTPSPGDASPVQSYPIPIALQGRPPVVVSGPFPLSETEWTQFKAVLEAMRPVLVSSESGTH